MFCYAESSYLIFTSPCCVFEGQMDLYDHKEKHRGASLTHVLAYCLLHAAVKRFREPVGIRRPWRIWSESLTSNTV